MKIVRWISVVTLMVSVLAASANAGTAGNIPIPASSVNGARATVVVPTDICTLTNGNCLTKNDPMGNAPSGTMCGSHREGGPQWVADIPCMGQPLVKTVMVKTWHPPIQNEFWSNYSAYYCEMYPIGSTHPIYGTVTGCVPGNSGERPSALVSYGGYWQSVPTVVSNCPPGYTYTSYVNDNGATATSAGIYYTCAKN